MVIRSRENWFRMLFIWKGSVLSKLIYRLLVLFIFSWGIYYLHGKLFSHKITLNPSAFTLIGVALAIFLAFCNNAAYDRFWEGRKLWGALIIDTRSIVRQVTSYTGKKIPQEETVLFARMVMAYAYCLNHQLRETDAAKDVNRLLPSAIAERTLRAKYKPVWLLKEMSDWLSVQAANSIMDDITKMGIDQNLINLSGIIGGCERIFNTPIPFAYHILLHRTVYIYCFLLPFGLVDSIGWMMPFVVAFAGYTFMALDAIVDEISEPFGREENDLALNSMCATVEHSLNELVGEKNETISVSPKNWYID